MHPQLSIVIPVYNSEKSINLLYEQLKKELKGEVCEVIFVDDASHDRSWEVLQQIKSESQLNITIIQLKHNIGQHRATLIGFMQCIGDIMVTLDDDLQHPPDEIKRLVQLSRKEKADVLYGVYRGRKQHSFVRNIASAFTAVASKYFSAHKKTKGSSFRVLTKEIVQQLVSHVNEFVYIEEAIHQYAQKIDFVEINHVKRKEGTSSYTILKLIELYLYILSVYHEKPLKKMLLISLGGMMAASAFIQYYVIDTEFPFLIKLVPLLVSLLLLGGGLFFASISLYCIFKRKTFLNNITPYQIKQHL